MIANERFGFIATDSGFGATWSENSYHNRLTPWSNDPIVDPPSEVVYLRDDKNGEFWTATPAPAAGAVRHVAKFGQGYATYSHRHRGLDVELTAFVPENDPVKILRLRIHNGSTTPRELSAFYYVDWCLSDTRTRSAAHIVTSIDTGLRGAVRAQCVPQRVRQPCGIHRRRRTEPVDDRRPFRVHRPQRHAVRSARDGVRPFARARGRHAGSMRRGADIGHRRCRGNDRGDILLGEGVDQEAARALVAAYHARGAVDTALQTIMGRWNTRLSAIEVETPDAALDILTNRWLVLPDVQLPLLRALGVLSIWRRVRVPRSAAGRAGLSALRSRHRARAHHSCRGTAVSRRRRAALVARAGWRGRAHPHLG